MKLLHDIIVFLLAFTASATAFWILMVISIHREQDREEHRQKLRAKQLEHRIVQQAMRGLQKRDGTYDGERIPVKGDQTEAQG